MNGVICVLLIVGIFPLLIAGASRKTTLGSIRGILGGMSLAAGSGQAFWDGGCFNNPAAHGLILLGMTVMGLLLMLAYFQAKQRLEVAGD